MCWGLLLLLMIRVFACVLVATLAFVKIKCTGAAWQFRWTVWTLLQEEKGATQRLVPWYNSEIHTFDERTQQPDRCWSEFHQFWGILHLWIIYPSTSIDMCSQITRLWWFYSTFVMSGQMLFLPLILDQFASFAREEFGNWRCNEPVWTQHAT